MGKLTTFTIVATSALVAYCAYFDYNRRTSPEFRKALKKRAAETNKLEQKKKEESKKSKMEAVKAALASDIDLPTDIGEKENFFMTQVAIGEQLSVAGKEVEAALSFYKALSIYPNPTDLLGIYQKSVPEGVYELIVMMIAVKPPASLSSILGNAAAADIAAEPVAPAQATEADLD
ncbi:uncharacterized protein KQ657_001424 [Scheffersomyces spartinae]|uniref:Mitochondrial import receptor subunit TOM20 n=1 Tax=Scheffersomyces spartinae TaxID=45513 RepID=A0A9P8AI01_9ASCO|nr:uncharacterized protein KQ657_001424 [Scheffersomyces spartinae]KAG7192644.1 hypothetical protein KQ657_001424 [Scheffersomyces spartinae]